MNLFTVEQLELVRRLRLSGMTADSIIEAYRSLDQIENELKLSSSSSSTTQQTQQTNTTSDTKTETKAMESPVVSALSQSTPLQTSPPAAIAANQLSSPIVRQLNPQAVQNVNQQRESSAQRCALTTVPESCLFGTSSLLSTASQPSTQSQNSPGCQTTPSSASSSSNSTTAQTTMFSAEHFRFPTAANQFCAPNIIAHQQLLNAQRAAIIPPPLPSPSMCRPLRPTQQARGNPRGIDIVVDNPTEVDEFMQQGEEFCINEMKKFITQYSLRQTTVAQLTGVSQPYISKLLNGNHRELSLRCRRNIYSWYLNCRRHPAIYCQDPTTRLETNGDGELVPQRRERYVFRPILIRILEAYFVESPFPDTQKRAEISQACNSALQAEKKGSHLMPKEVVTPQVIANWFANKRKEMRRKSNEENRPRINGVQFSDIASTPSPSGSSTANAESPIATMIPSGLLAPLQFSAQNPFSMLMQQQQQQQQPLSMESFLEARQPILPLGVPTSIPTSLSELLLKQQLGANNDVAAQFQLQGLFPSPFRVGNQESGNDTESMDQSSETPTNDQNNLPPPLLCPIKDDESVQRDEQMEKSPKAMKMTDADAPTGEQMPNQALYAELFQKMIDSGVINMLQQQMNSS